VGSAVHSDSRSLTSGPFKRTGSAGLSRPSRHQIAVPCRLHPLPEIWENLMRGGKSGDSSGLIEAPSTTRLRAEEKLPGCGKSQSYSVPLSPRQGRSHPPAARPSSAARQRRLSHRRCMPCVGRTTAPGRDPAICRLQALPDGGQEAAHAERAHSAIRAGPRSCFHPALSERSSLAKLRSGARWSVPPISNPNNPIARSSKISHSTISRL
jgi:hypothetical protein